MNQIVITKTDQAVSNLAELAKQIDAEHHLVESAVRDSVAHANRAGILLRQAKSKVPHGSWIPWLEGNSKVSPRTAQRYMRLAAHWEEMLAKGGETLGMQRALSLLSQQEDEPNTTRVSHLPAALAFFQEKGLIDDESMQGLLELANDYGPEIMTRILFRVQPSESEVWWYLNAIRPLDHPPLWPFPFEGATTPGLAAVIEATNVFIEDGRRRGHMPQWEVTAFWFAATMVHLAARYPNFAEKFKQFLFSSLNVWRESFRTALVMIANFGHDFVKTLEDGSLLWICYVSDLRHAGILQAALAVRDDLDVYPNLQKSLTAGIDAIERTEDYALPSCMQRGDRTEKPAHDDAREHSADRLME